ncbi:MAG: restriction endonuclease [Pseudomonadota bacterium]
MGTVYDFRTLSPLDFEELDRDLLQAQWGVTLESFGAGTDQGIDLRYLTGPHKVIIQAKHLSEGGYTGLKRALRDERLKAMKLAPTRYLLATSVSLTPARKDEIIALMEGVPLTPGDIFGREDLNNLLGLHQTIETRHFKLWLSSANARTDPAKPRLRRPSCTKARPGPKPKTRVQQRLKAGASKIPAAAAAAFDPIGKKGPEPKDSSAS